MDKLISIIIPCYNVEKYIDRCIRSLVRQTIGVDKLELILVDDASIDNTWGRMKVWEKRFTDSVILIKLTENMRQGGARNAGLLYASAPYIGFVDSDDWVEETMYEKLYKKIEEYSCDIVSCLFQRDRGMGEIYPKIKKDDIYRKILSNDDKKAFFMSGLPGGIVSKLYKSELICNSNIKFPEHLTYEDNYWMPFVMLHVQSYYILQETLYHYFVNTDSTILKKNTMHHLDRMKIETMKLSEYRKRNVFDLYKEEIEFKFLKLYYLNTMNILLLRFDSFPDGIFEELKETVHRLFPDYKKNSYLSSLHEMEQAVLMTLEKDYDNEGLNGLAKRYKKLYNVI